MPSWSKYLEHLDDDNEEDFKPVEKIKRNQRREEEKRKEDRKPTR
jgi:hypothetical protein